MAAMGRSLLYFRVERSSAVRQPPAGLAAPPLATRHPRSQPAYALLPPCLCYHMDRMSLQTRPQPRRKGLPCWLTISLSRSYLLHLPPASQLAFHTAVGAPVDAAAAATATVTARMIIDATLSGSDIRGSVNLPGALLRVPSRSTSQFVPEIQRWCKDISRLAFTSRTCSPPPPLTCWHATAPRR